MSRDRLSGLVLVAAALAGCSGSTASAKREVEIGNDLARHGRFNEATEAYQRAINVDRMYGEAYYRLALVDWELGRGASLERNLRRAAELQPTNKDALEKLSELYLLSYQSDENADRRRTYVTELSGLGPRLVALNERSYSGARIQGYVALYNRDFRNAVSSFERALQFGADAESAHTVAADLFRGMIGQNRAADAESFADAYLLKNPSATPVYAVLVAHYQDRRETAKALAVLQRRAQENPKIAEAQIELAAAYQSAGKTSDAEHILQRVSTDVATYPTGLEMAGDFYARNGDSASAIRAYKLGETQQPQRKSMFQLKRARMLRREGRTAVALELVNDVLKQQPDQEARRSTFEAQLMQAALVGDMGYPSGSKPVLDAMSSLREKHPKEARVLVELGRAYQSAGLMKEAGQMFDDAIFREPGLAEAREARAGWYEAQNQFGLMRESADRALRIDPKSPKALLLRAIAFRGMGVNQSAREDLNRVLQSWPDFPDAQYHLAVLNMRDRNWKEAEAGFRKLAGLGDTKAIVGLAEVYRGQQQYIPAMRLLRKAIENGGKTLEIRRTLALTATSAGLYEDALTTLKALIAEYPGDLSLRLQMVTVYREKGDAQAALQEARNVVNAFPKEPAALLQLAALTEVMTKDRDETRRLYESVLQQLPDDPTAASRLAALIVEDRAEWVRALDLAQRAVRSSNADPDALATLAFVYSGTDHHHQAVSLYQTLLGRNPHSVKLHIGLANALARSGEKVKAREQLQFALRSNPTSEEATAIHAELAKF